MKKALIIIITFAGLGIASYNIVFGTKKEPPSAVIVSPLPELLVKSFYKAGDLQDYWKPKVPRVGAASSEMPELTAVSALSYDLTTETFILSKESDRKLPIASLTKIMTAIVAFENESLTKEITVSRHAAEIGENVMGLTEGEKITYEELLYGLFLLSGNDAAEAIAENSQFGRDNFVYLMNKKAEDLGLGNTHFTNPSGLEGDGNQYSTAQDLLVMARYGLQKEDFARISSAVYKEIPYSEKHKAFYLSNETNLMTTYPGVKGIKTGFTNEAGFCLVTYLEYEGHKIIAVILNSQNRRQEMKELLDYSLKSLGIKPPMHE